jgi:hypothetical protein
LDSLCLSVYYDAENHSSDKARQMSFPPFKRTLGGLAIVGQEATHQLASNECCQHEASKVDVCATRTRLKLHELDPALHCSVVGNCLSPAELRKLLAKHMDLTGMSDLEIHKKAVSAAGQRSDLSKALNKALDHRHAGAVQSFSVAKNAASLLERWKQAWAQGDITGAYWAVLTHKALTADLCQIVFGEVHMLSHLMAAANRHELKRFVQMERENAELHKRLEFERCKKQELVQERDQLAEKVRQQAVEFEQRTAQLRMESSERAAASFPRQVADLQTQRREHAERIAQASQNLVLQLKEELAGVKQHRQYLLEDLAAAETELQCLSGASNGQVSMAADNKTLLHAKKVLYVGGRPSSSPAIRDYVHRYGGEFLHHDGGLEDRKGLLDRLLPRASLVVFPVDCVDHDSVAKLKRLSERHQVPFIPLRSASLASFAAAIKREFIDCHSEAVPRFPLCLRHS